jgi:hypothetical protein
MTKIPEKLRPAHVDSPCRWINHSNRRRLGGRLKRATRQAQPRTESHAGLTSDPRVTKTTLRARLGAILVLAGTLIGAHAAVAQVPPGGTIVGTPGVSSTTPVTPFLISGYIENFKLLPPPPGTPIQLTGATMTVNGQDVVIPANTIVEFPASQLTPYDIFHMAPSAKLAANLANNESGLALNDINRPLTAFEATLIGNIVNGKYIAGLTNIAQEFLQVHQGYVTNIDYATGDFCVTKNNPSGPLSNRGGGCIAGETRVKLNDPLGRYGKQRTEGDQDPRLVVDDGNPTVFSATAYPMCIPRVAPPAVDPVCPISNRPIDPVTKRAMTRFIMDTVDRPPVIPGAAPLAGATDIPSCRKGLILGVLGRDCDSRQQAPFMLGDFLSITSSFGQDGSPFNGGRYLSAWGVQALVGISTKPCGIYGINPIADPTGAVAGTGLPNSKCNPLVDISYMDWETGLVGTKGTSGPPAILEGALVETSDRLHMGGMTTDPTRLIEIYAIDTASNLRWITDVTPLRVPYGRYEIFVQKDIVAHLPIATTGGPIPIVDNHLGVDFGAPRQLYVHMSNAQEIFTRSHNVKPVPGVCGGLIFPGCPPLNGAPFPTADQLINPTTGKVYVIANGLVPSQYSAPSVQYFFPETVQIGDPQTPANFECLDFVVKGWQISTPALGSIGVTGTGQLNPWPGGELGGAVAPPATDAGIACTPR